MEVFVEAVVWGLLVVAVIVGGIIITVSSVDFLRKNLRWGIEIMWTTLLTAVIMVLIILVI